jgi:hypothetical protein
LRTKFDVRFAKVSSPHVGSAPIRWADVFASDNGRYDRYGYNVTEDRWSYDIEPPASEKIRRAILNFRKG